MLRRLLIACVMSAVLSAAPDADSLAAQFASRLKALPEVSSVRSDPKGSWKKPTAYKHVGEAYVFVVNFKKPKSVDVAKFRADMQRIADDLQLDRNRIRRIVELNVR